MKNNLHTHGGELPDGVAEKFIEWARKRLQNYPSGDSRPSKDDLEITKRLTEAGKTMGFEIMDHVIVSKNGYFNVKEFQYSQELEV